MKCSDVPRQHLNYVWPQIEGYMARSMERDPGRRMLPIDLFGLLVASNGCLRLWVAYSPESKEIVGFTVTEVFQWPRARELRFWMIGGKNLPAWRDEMRLTLEAYARDEGCDYIAIFGRKAWARMPGYEQQSHVSIFKRLKIDG